MRVPYSWLTEAIIETNPHFCPTPELIQQALLDLGHEIEAIHSLGPITGPVRIGQVTHIEQLTGFKKPIRACQVDVGEETPRDIVCGATNFTVGDLVIVALPGAILPGDFSITTRKVYRRTSDGMICSASELGIPTEQTGILVLPPHTGLPGDDALPIVGTDDYIYELTTTPDRGYCLSIRGLVRDITALLDLQFHDLADLDYPRHQDQAWPLVVEPQTGVRRFSMRTVQGINPQTVSPWWLQRRLLLCGMNTINPIVDVTNYVMMELGHPLHAHDQDRIQGDIFLRYAQPDETVVTLDGVQRSLYPSDVVVADSHGVLAIGGVMGGQTSHIHPDTTNILLEAAVWDPAAVSRTARRLRLTTEAARRYERSVDPAISQAVLQRCITLLTSIAGGHPQPTVTDWISTQYGDTFCPPAINMSVDLPTRTIGVTYSSDTVERRLTQIGCTVEGRSFLTVTPPSWRPDLTQPADLVEEILRLEGMHTVPSVMVTPPPGKGLTPIQSRRRAVAKALAMNGFVEILPSPFMDPTIFDTWGLETHDPRRSCLTVTNPLDPAHYGLATTLLPTLLETLLRNLSRGNTDVAIFGIAPVAQLKSSSFTPVEPIPTHQKISTENLESLNSQLPDQPCHIGALLVGLKDPAGPWGPGRLVEPSDAIEAARIIARTYQIDFTVQPAHYLPWHPGRCAQLSINGTTIGHAGQLHPAILERLNLPQNTCALEINLDALPIIDPKPNPQISSFPPIYHDLAVVVDHNILAADVANALRDGGGELVEEVKLFDTYTGPQIGEGKKSLTFALRFRDTERTLTDAEATIIRDGALQCAYKRCGAFLRS